MVNTPLTLLVLLMLGSAVLAHAKLHFLLRRASTKEGITMGRLEHTGIREGGYRMFQSSSVIYACSGGKLALPWIASLNSSHVIDHVTWFMPSENTLVIAAAADNRFLPTPSYVGRVRQTTNAGITIENLTTSDAGNYSVDVLVQNGEGGIDSRTASVYVYVSVEQEIQVSLQPTTDHEGIFLGCGQFAYANLPHFRVSWVTPSNEIKPSTSYEDGRFLLKLKFPVELGQYKCLYPAEAACSPDKSDFATLSVSDECTTKGGEMFKDFCYIYKQTKMTWRRAKAACEDMSAQLVEVYSEDVNNFLENMMNSYGYGGEDRCTWMGLTDMSHENKFLWDASQREPSYNDWAAGEPNNIGGNEDCTHFFLFDYEVWNDAPCHFKFRFICQLRME